MKQTAVEWYEKEINSLFEKYQAKEISERDFITMKHNLFYPAKEMEKEQKNQMYSETEVLQLLIKLKQTESFDNLYDWFNQNKKTTFKSK